MSWWIEEKGTVKRSGSRTVSLSEAKRRVSMAQLLRSYGLEVEHEDPDWHAVRCPFHKDNNPSASVNHRLNRFRCHVCDIGGDVIDVISQHEGLSTKEALEWLTNRF